MRLAIVFLTVLMNLSCKPASSKLQSLDNFTAGSRVRLNQCSGEEAKQYDLVSFPLLNATYFAEPASKLVKDAVARSLTAIPEDIHQYLSRPDIRFKIIVTRLTPTICGERGVSACTLMANRASFARFDVRTKLTLLRMDPTANLGFRWVFLTPDEEEIRFGLVREFGYLLSQGFDFSYESDAKAAKNQLLTAYLQDLRQKSGPDVDAIKSRANEARVLLADAVFSESFDSYFCDRLSTAKNRVDTWGAMQREFPQTAKIFPAIYNRIVDLSNRPQSNAPSSGRQGSFALTDDAPTAEAVEAPAEQRAATETTVEPSPSFAEIVANSQTDRIGSPQASAESTNPFAKFPAPSGPDTEFYRGDEKLIRTTGLKPPTTFTSWDLAAAHVQGFGEHFVKMGSDMANGISTLAQAMPPVGYPGGAISEQNIDSYVATQRYASARQAEIVAAVRADMDSQAKAIDEFNANAAKNHQDPFLMSGRTYATLKYIPLGGAVKSLVEPNETDANSAGFGKPAPILNRIGEVAGGISAVSGGLASGTRTFLPRVGELPVFRVTGKVASVRPELAQAADGAADALVASADVAADARVASSVQQGAAAIDRADDFTGTGGGFGPASRPPPVLPASADPDLIAALPGDPTIEREIATMIAAMNQNESTKAGLLQKIMASNIAEREKVFASPQWEKLRAEKGYILGRVDSDNQTIVGDFLRVDPKFIPDFDKHYINHTPGDLAAALARVNAGMGSIVRGAEEGVRLTHANEFNRLSVLAAETAKMRNQLMDLRATNVYGKLLNYETSKRK